MGVDDETDIGLASVLGQWDTRRQRAAKGAILIKGSEQPWETQPAGPLPLLRPPRPDRSGQPRLDQLPPRDPHPQRHAHPPGRAGAVRHQGPGLHDLQRAAGDWKEGDVILLPIEPGGVEHQHFNLGDEPCEWIAFAFNPWLDAMGNGYEQRQDHPDYRPGDAAGFSKAQEDPGG